MKSAVAKAVTAALRAVHALAYVDCIYQRRGSSGAWQKIPLRAVRSDVDLETVAGDVATTTRRATLWRVLAADLIFGGQMSKPQEGDRIEVLVGASREVFEAQPIFADSCYEVTDPDGQGYRVQTRLIDSL